MFRGWRGDRIKILWWDGDGLCLFAKRLESGRFIGPQATDGVVSLTPAQFSMLRHRLAASGADRAVAGGVTIYTEKMTDDDALPDTLPTLKATIASQRMEIIQQRAEIAHLKPWIAKPRRHRFGRRSERAGTRLDPLELQLEELETGTRQTGRASILEIICATFAARCKPTATPASTVCTRAVRSWKSRVGRTSGASFTTSITPTPAP